MHPECLRPGIGKGDGRRCLSLGPPLPARDCSVPETVTVRLAGIPATTSPSTVSGDWRQGEPGDRLDCTPKLRHAEFR